jgi:hypothetical protein
MEPVDALAAYLRAEQYWCRRCGAPATSSWSCDGCLPPARDLDKLPQVTFGATSTLVRAIEPGWVA